MQTTKNAHADAKFEAGYFIGALTRGQLLAVLAKMGTGEMALPVFTDELRAAVLAMVGREAAARDFIAAYHRAFHAAA